MSELSEEEIVVKAPYNGARFIIAYKGASLDGMSYPTAEAAQAELDAIRAALLQPALERARREGYAIGFGASAEGYNSEYPFDGDFSGDPKWQAVRETEIAAAIRKG